jgi:hypothetical protein
VAELLASLSLAVIRNVKEEWGDPRRVTRLPRRSSGTSSTSTSCSPVKGEMERMMRELQHPGPEQELEKELQLDRLQTLTASRTDLTSQDVSGHLKALRPAEQQKLQQLGKSNPDCYKAVL